MSKILNYKKNLTPYTLNLKPRVMVGMSGGVDSSVAAALLVKQGYQVIGVFLKFWSDPKCKNRKENTCCNYQSLVAARSVAEKLKIPFYVFDVSREFKKEVVDYFISEYDSGRTPNPCVVCNKKIKFGWMLEQAKKLGCDYIATGHYARLRRETLNTKFETLNKFQIPNKFEIRNSIFETNHKSKIINHKLFRSKDKKKDQSYFLWQLDQKQLAHILFPIGDYTKEEVRKMAKKWQLPTAQKKESQDLCFISRDQGDFLADYAEKLNQPGEVVDLEGNVLGRHKGLCYYTVGQRQGLNGVQLKTKSEKLKTKNLKSNHKSSIINHKSQISGFQPTYVLKLDIDNNQLVVGLKKDLYSNSLEAERVNFLPNTNKTKYEKNQYQAKIRYGARAAKCKVLSAKGNTIQVKFQEPQRAITPGQSVVFYQNEELIGGGIIAKSH